MEIQGLWCVRVLVMNMWETIKQHLAAKLNPESYQNWFANTRFLQMGSGSLTVSVPNEATKTWLEEEYAELIAGAIKELRLPVAAVRYELPQAVDRNGSSLSIHAGPDGAAELFARSAETRLNPKFRFETFVVGSCNQFAHAAAQAVATNPSRSYNPLFIYGGVGMGKTHLMHAVGRSLLDNFSGMRIVYTSSERFMNEMIHCISTQRMSQFHQHYRSADVLLVDDIQILGGKERTQEEFFHTFNELYDHQKQIVLSSDSQPKEIPGLVERLRSRFEWGLMVDMQPPDLETKMAILDSKAAAEGIKLPEDVRIFIATKTKSNVRELEGALIKLIAYSSVTGTPISLPMTQHCLKHIVQSQERKAPKIETIIRIVGERFGLQSAQLKQKSNTRAITYPRQIAMYLAKDLTSASLPEIGRLFGGKHHTTVLHSIQKIETQRHRDPELNRLIHSLIDSIN